MCVYIYIRVCVYVCIYIYVFIYFRCLQERNYHCFYQLFAGLDAAQKAELRLSRPEDYNYLKGGMIRVAAIDDAAAYTELVAAMRTIGITIAQQQGVQVQIYIYIYIYV